MKKKVIVRGERTRTGAVGGTVAGSDTNSSCTEGQCEWDSVNWSVNTGIKNKFIW
jgi:hypothetical protein